MSERELEYGIVDPYQTMCNDIEKLESVAHGQDPLGHRRGEHVVWEYKDLQGDWRYDFTYTSPYEAELEDDELSTAEWNPIYPTLTISRGSTAWVYRLMANREVEFTFEEQAIVGDPVRAEEMAIGISRLLEASKQPSQNWYVDILGIPAVSELQDERTSSQRIWELAGQIYVAVYGTDVKRWPHAEHNAVISFPTDIEEKVYTQGFFLRKPTATNRAGEGYYHPVVYRGYHGREGGYELADDNEIWQINSSNFERLIGDESDMQGMIQDLKALLRLIEERPERVLIDGEPAF